MKNLFPVALVLFLTTVTGTFQCIGQRPRLLVISKTNGFRHKAIPAATLALQKLGEDNHWAIDFTEDSTRLGSYKILKRYDAVIFLFATGKILGAEGEEALKKYLEKGGGLATVHTGTDVEKNWDWYMQTIGAKFKGHPKQQSAVFNIEDPLHPATNLLPKQWTHFDELYNFAGPVSKDVHVLLSVDEASYQGGTMDNHHPMAWTSMVGKKGRIFQTALGHTEACYSDSLFLGHLKGGIEWAGGQREKQ